MSAESYRYARHLTLPGFDQAAQDTLSDASVLLVGLGGLGSPAAAYLAAAGIGHLLINDFDTVHESNLHRQLLYESTDVGKRKIAAAASRIKKLNPQCHLTSIDERLPPEKLAEFAAPVSVVLDATDNFASRKGINDACIRHKKTLISGAAVGMDGQVAVFNCDGVGPCYQCFLNGIGDNLGDCEGDGVLGPITGVVGTLMALEAIKLITGLGKPLLGKVMIFDGLNSAWKTLKLERNLDCTACGSEHDLNQ